MRCSSRAREKSVIKPNGVMIKSVWTELAVVSRVTTKHNDRRRKLVVVH
jgi:hypothetical protein